MSRSRRTTAGAWVVALGLLIAASGGVLAQAAAAAPGQDGRVAPKEPAEQYVPVKSIPQQDSLPAAPLLVVAYGFVWVALLVYVWSIWRRLMKVEHEIQALSSRIADVGPRR